MKLFKELDISIKKPELISITGGGGKTTSMFRLGRELKKFGKKVLITTTTGIFTPQEGTYEKLILLEEDENDLNDLPIGITIIGSKIDKKKKKLMGIDVGIIDEFFKNNLFDYIIVEADGSKRKSIKAPASHEPVIPSLTTKTIGVIGMDVVHKRIYEENVHRANIFANLTNSKLGDIINEDVIYNLIISKKGIFKGSPKGSDRYIILNKVETNERRKVAEKIKYKLLMNNINIKNLIIGSIGKEAKVTGIIMASGFSRRMKRDKLLLKLGDMTVIERVIKSCVRSNLDDIIVIYRRNEIRDIAIRNNLKTVFNEFADKGQSESIKRGVNSISKDTEGIMFIVGDQPHLDSKTINRLLDEFERDKEKIIIPIYNKSKGNPTIFPISLKKEFFSLKGDVGGKEIINNNLEQVNYIEIKNYKAGRDMDTVEEYEKLKEDFN